MTTCICCFGRIDGTVYVRPLRFGNGDPFSAPFCGPCDRKFDSEVPYDRK